MLAIVPSATLHGLDGRFIRVEVDVAPGSARASRSSGWPTPRSRRRANGSAAPCATPGSSIHRAGSPSISRRPTSARPARRSISRWRSGSCSARSRSRPGRDDWRSSASCRSAARCGPCRASCRWWPSCRGAVCGGSWSPPPRSTRRGSSTGSRWSASRRCVDAVAVVRTRRARRVAPPPPRIELVEAVGTARRRRARLPVSPGRHGRGPDLCRGARPGRGAARARDRPGRRSRPAADRAARDRARRSWLGRSPGCCRRSAMPRPWRRPSSRRPPARGRSPSCGDGRRSGRRTTRSRTPAMVGGGPNMSPGEVTRADQGVLFLDELPEFGRDVLEALRQPMEEGRVAVSRVGRATIFPARFQLVAAMNPCPCGFAGQLRSGRARCPPMVPERYQRRVSGSAARPDRPVDLDAARRAARARARAGAGGLGGRRGTDRGGTSRVALARPSGALNGRLTRTRACATPAASTAATERRVVQLADLERASGRGTERLLRVARTIADLAGRGRRRATTHLDEAAWFRPADMRLAAAEVVLTCSASVRRDRPARAERGRARPAPAAPRPVADVPRPCRPPRSATPGPCWLASAGSGRSASVPCCRRYGSAIAILREAASRGRTGAPGGGRRRPSRAARPAATASPRSWRPGSPRRPSRPTRRSNGSASSASTIVTLDDPTYPTRLGAIEMPPHVLFLLGDPAALDTRCGGRDRRDAASDRPGTGRRRAPGDEPRGGRGVRRLGARGRHRRCGPRRGGPRRRHDRGGHRIGPRDAPSARPRPAGRQRSSPRVARSCRSSARTSCRARARSRAATGSSAGWPMRRSSSRHRPAAAR